MDVVIALLIVFLAGVGVGTFVIGSQIRAIVSETVATVHNDYAEVESKTRSLIAAGVTRLDEIKKAL